MKPPTALSGRSLLMTSAGWRVAIALVAVAVIWLAVGWAIGMPS